MKRILKSIFIACFIAILFGYSGAEAHQPNFADTQTGIKISDPEISRAFYGTLNGKPTIYEINSPFDFQLYVGLLSPDITETRTNFSAIITDKNGKVAELNGNNFIWNRWYEKFAGDWYWQGPEIKKAVPSGDYFISISNPNNQGKYVLAVGETESFPVSQIPHTFSELIKIKTQFFGKPWYSAFTNKIGLYAGLGLLAVIALCVVILFLIKFIIKKRQKQNNSII